MFSLIFAPLALAQVSAFTPQINYQGKLTDASNVAVPDGTYNVSLRLYTTAAGATTSAIWSEDRVNANRVTVSNGLFSVLLGSVTAFPASFDWNRTLYLGVEIGGTTTPGVWDGEMTPRKQLGAVPAAFTADRLDNIDSTQFVRTDATSTIASSSPDTTLTVNQTGSGNVLDLQTAGISRLLLANNGNLGIGTSSPYAKLSVAGDVVAARFVATSTTATSSFQNTSVNQLQIAAISGVLRAVSGYIQGGATTADLPEGANLYFTNARADARINATTSIGTLLAAPALATVGTLTTGSIGSGFGSIDVGANAITGGTGTFTNLSISNTASTTFLVATTSTFGTTTVTNLLTASRATFTNATTSTFGITDQLVHTGSGTSTFSNGIALSNGCFRLPNGSCLTDTTGITSLNGLTALSQSFATSSDTNITLSIVSSGSTHTFTPGWTGSLAVTRGGTGLISTPNFGEILRGNGAGGYALVATSTLGINILDTTGALTVARGGTGLTSVTDDLLLIGGPGNTILQIATSSLGLVTTNVAEGTNQYFTDARARNAVTGLFPSTTTPNTWTALQTFSDLIATNATNTNATSSFLSVANHLFSGTSTLSTIFGTTATFQNATTTNLGVTGQITSTGSGTSTFANGISLSNGCFRDASGACVTSSATGAQGGAGAVQFANGTAFSGDATNFFWNNTTKALVIGTSTPFAKLSVQGAFGSTLPLFDIASSTNSSGSATTSLFAINADGSVVINSPTVGELLPTDIFSVNGGNNSSASAIRGRGISLSAGSAPAGTSGGGISLTAGRGAFLGGAISLTGGYGITSGASVGGSINLSGGGGNSQGGQVNILGGNGTASGGGLTLTAGNATSSGAGGNISITAGNASSSGAGGNITINPGSSSGIGASGNILLSTLRGNVGIGTSSPYAKLSVVGETVSAFFTATTTSVNTFPTLLSTNATTTNLGVTGQITQTGVATSTFNGGIALSGGCFQDTTGKCIGKGRDGTYIVAAYNSTNKAYADYVTDYTNDEVEINQAITAAYSSTRGRGGKVYLLEGDFRVGTSTAAGDALVIATSTSLIGAGNGTTITLASSTPGDANVIAARNLTEISISDLTINGNKANQTTGTQNGVNFSSTASSTVTRVNITDVRTDGLSLTSSLGNKITLNTIMRSGAAGVLLAVSDFNIIEGNISNSNVGIGISIAGSNSNTITSNTIGQNDTGIQVFGGAQSYNTIANNVVWGSLRYGINMSGFGGVTTHNVVTANVIRDSADCGISVHNFAASNSIIGNSLYNNGGSGAISSIKVGLGASQNIISGNRIVDTAGTAYAIDIEGVSAPSNNVLTGNYYSGTGATRISDAGTNTKYTQWDRITLENPSGAIPEVTYSLLGIVASTTAPLASTTQLGSGKLLSLNNTLGEMFTVANDGRIGVASSTPYAMLGVVAPAVSSGNGIPGLIVTGGLTTAAVSSGGQVSLAGGKGTLVGGAILLTGGSGDALGGAVDISGGISALNGGAVTISGGSSATNGGALTLQSGAGTTSGTGSSGALSIRTPNGAGGSASAGSISVTGGNGFFGGSILLTAGNANSGGAGGGSGNVTVTAGESTISGSTAGNVTINPGGGTATGSVNIASLRGNVLLANGGGNVGIGTSSPYAKLSVVGETVSAFYTATTTSANTFPTLLSTNATTTNLGVTGQITQTGSATSTFTGGLSLGTGGLHVTNGGIRVNNLNAALCDLKSDTNGSFYCGADASGGSEINWTWFNNSGIRLSTTTNQVLIGAVATTSLAKLEVAGDIRAEYFTATSSATSTFAGGISLSGGCFQDTTGKCIGKGRDGTYIVAAYNSTNKAYADYVADYTNDEVQINQAITAAYSATRGRGGKVYLLEGDFRVGTSTAVGDSIVMATSTSLIGAGNGTTITLASSTPGDANVIAARGASAVSMTDVVIRDLLIDGNRANQSTGTQQGVYFSAAASSTIASVTIRRTRSGGIVMDGSATNNNWINDNSIIELGSTGIILRDGASYITIARNKIKNAAAYGIASGISSASTHVIIDANEVANMSGFAAIEIGNASYAVVSNNNVHDNTAVGILGGGGAGRHVVIGNLIANNSLEGIKFTGTSNNTIVGNSLYNNAGSGANDSIELSGTMTNTTIASNHITDTAGTGFAIDISSTVSGTILTGNYYSGTGATRISDAGTNTKYTQWDRITLENPSGAIPEVTYSLLSIVASTTAPLASTTQTGAGKILSLNNRVGEMFAVSNSGLVGIGTSSPYAKLSVVGETVSAFFTGTTTATSTFGGNLAINGTGTTTSNGGFNLSAGCFAVNGTCVGGGSTPAVGGTGAIQFANSAALNGDATNFFWDNSNKRLGIGTSTPSERLAIHGGSILQRGGVASSWYVPQLVSTTSIGSSASELAIDGNFAYVSEGGAQDRLAVVDISNAERPRLIGTAPSANANAVAVSGRYAYTAQYTSPYLKVFDLAETNAPKEVASLTLPGPNVTHISIAGSYAYLTGENLGGYISVVDISQPTSPKYIKSLTASNLIFESTVREPYLYISTDASWLEVFDISNPRDPLPTGFVAASGRPRAMGISGNYIYTAGSTGTNDFKVIDISTPRAPTVTATISLGGTIDAAGSPIPVAGRYAYVIDDLANQLIVVDVASSSNPYIVGTTTLPYQPANAAISGKHLYIVSTGGVLMAYDITGIEAQSLLAHSLEAGTARVRSNLDVGAHVNVGGQIQAAGGIVSRAGGLFTRFSTSSLASVHALIASVIDSGSSGVSDVMYLNHSASSTASNGIGTGLLYGAEDETGYSTSTAQIAAILTSTSSTSPASVLTFSTKNSSSGLTEWMRLSASGNLGIGTTSPYRTLSVVGTAAFTATTTFGIPGSTSANASILVVNGGICVDNDGDCTASTTGRISAVSYTTGATDLAENYFATSTLEAGEIVAIAASNTPAMIARAERHRASFVLGIVSTEPAIILGEDPDLSSPAMRVPVALSGRVPVKVSTENGRIRQGDRITLSSVPGMGMKASASSTVTVGIALEDFRMDPNILDTRQEGKVLAFVSLTHAALDDHIVAGTISLRDSSNGSTTPVWTFDSTTGRIRYLADRPIDFGGQRLENVRAIASANGTWSLDEDGNLTARKVNAEEVNAATITAQKLCVGSTCLSQDQFQALLINAGIDPSLVTNTGSAISPEEPSSLLPPATAPPAPSESTATEIGIEPTNSTSQTEEGPETPASPSDDMSATAPSISDMGEAAADVPVPQTGEEFTSTGP